MLATGPQYLGDFVIAALVQLKFTTFAATGAPTTLAGTPAISVYKNSDTTESTSGITLGVDFDSVTGLNRVTIDTSSDGTFYSAGAEFQIVITTGTVSAVSVVGYVVGSFSLNNRSALRPTTAGRTLDVASTGEAGLDFDNIKAASSPTVLTNITVPAVSAVGTVSGDVLGNVDGNVGGNVVGTVASVVGNVGGNLLGTLSSTERLAIADANLTRDMSAVSPQPALNARCPLNAQRFLRNAWTLAANILTVMKEDDATPAWTGTITTNSAALPVTGSDPA